VSTIVERAVGLHDALERAGLPHAFGGALALGWCTRRPRGTSDIDLNVFVDASRADAVLAALPDEIVPTDEQRATLARDGQARVHWANTPVDLFLDTTPFHRDVLLRIREEDLGGRTLPFLGCTDLAVFKAFFDRTKDWADLEEMAATGSLDGERVLGVLVTYLGGNDHRVERFLRLPPRRGDD
jgi:hypothetical protein